MGIPTVLIGCLPSYHHIGIAAPILLAILRLIQGLAMGGEFGAVSITEAKQLLCNVICEWSLQQRTCCSSHIHASHSHGCRV
jgi:hypothetical protein